MTPEQQDRMLAAFDSIAASSASTDAKLDELLKHARNTSINTGGIQGATSNLRARNMGMAREVGKGVFYGFCLTLAVIIGLYLAYIWLAMTMSSVERERRARELRKITQPTPAELEVIEESERLRQENLDRLEADPDVTPTRRDPTRSR